MPSNTHSGLRLIILSQCTLWLGFHVYPHSYPHDHEGGGLIVCPIISMCKSLVYYKIDTNGNTKKRGIAGGTRHDVGEAFSGSSLGGLGGE